MLEIFLQLRKALWNGREEKEADCRDEEGKCAAPDWKG